MRGTFLWAGFLWAVSLVAGFFGLLFFSENGGKLAMGIPFVLLLSWVPMLVGAVLAPILWRFIVVPLVQRVRTRSSRLWAVMFASLLGSLLVLATCTVGVLAVVTQSLLGAAGVGAALSATFLLPLWFLVAQAIRQHPN